MPTSRSATAVRVRQVADELGYRRSVFASSLRRGATGTIGVLVPRLSDAVMALMFEAIERAARRADYFAVVATCGDAPDDERRATETLLDRNVDGLILATARVDDELPESLRARGIPHVFALRTDGSARPLSATTKRAGTSPSAISSTSATTTSRSSQGPTSPRVDATAELARSGR